MNIRKLAITITCLALISLMAVEFNSVYAQSDKAHDDVIVSNGKLDISAPLQHMSIIQFKQKLDSVYAMVSATYATVEPMLKNSCYDCHSDQTNYPWYYKIPTIDAMIDSDIKEGRKHIDMSNGFPFGGKGDQLKLLAELREEVEENEMPLISYRLMHWGSTIEGVQQDSLFKWIDESTAIIKKAYQNLGLPVPGEKDEHSDEGDEESDDH